MKKEISLLGLLLSQVLMGLYAQNQRLSVGRAGAPMNEPVLTSQNDQQITVRFDLNELDLAEVKTANSIYYLHVNDGVNQNPVMQQILVEH